MAAKEVIAGGEASQGWKTRFAFGALAIAIVGIVLQAGGLLGLIPNPYALVLPSGLTALISGSVSLGIRTKNRNSGFVGTFASCAVIAGILLFSMGAFAVPIASLEKAKQRASLAICFNFKSAIENFDMEYGELPKLGSKVQTAGSDGEKLLSILTGTEQDPATGQNSKAIKFLSVRMGKHGKGGAYYGGDGVRMEGVYDSWGRPFVVHMNVGGGSILRFHYAGKTVELPGRIAAVYSLGKDGKPGTADDVKTW